MKPHKLIIAILLSILMSVLIFKSYLLIVNEAYHYLESGGRDGLLASDWRSSFFRPQVYLSAAFGICSCFSLLFWQKRLKRVLVFSWINISALILSIFGRIFYIRYTVLNDLAPTSVDYNYIDLHTTAWIALIIIISSNIIFRKVFVNKALDEILYE